MSRTRRWFAAVIALVATLSCSAETRLPTAPGGSSGPGLEAIAVRLTVDLEAGEVRLSEPAPTGAGRLALAILGGNEVGVVTSNLVRYPPVQGRARVTFDIALLNRLTSATLIVPTVPPGGAAGLLLLPYRVGFVVGGTPAQVSASTDWDGDGSPGSGAPRNFFNDFGCSSTGTTSDCLRWEQYPAPLGPGATTAPRTVGYSIPQAVTSFQVQLLVAADISSDLPPVARIDVTPSSYIMADGFPAGFSATAYDASNNPLPWASITWLSPDPAVLAFQYGGALVGVFGGPSVVVHGRTVGLTAFTANSGGISTTVPLDIQVNTVALVQLYTPDSSITVGDQLQGDARVKDHSGFIIPGFQPTWSSSDPNVLTVDQTGLITAVGPGTADITATAGLQSASVTITVVTGWTTKASMPTPRTQLAAGVINGILYAVGGVTGGFSGAVEAYDPTTDSWSTKAGMPTPRSSPGVGVINGILYAVGGFNGPAPNALGTVEAYDPATNSWTTKAVMPTPRSSPAVAVINGILYAVGGFDANFKSLGTVEAYDPASDSWSTKAAMPMARSGLVAGAINGTLYVAGGFNSSLGTSGTVEAYDPTSDSWSPRAALPTPRDAGTGGVINGILYVVGGSNLSLGMIGPVHAYDPAIDAWSTKAAIPAPRNYSSAGVINGVLYVVGGNAGSGSLDFLEAYEP